MSNAALLPSAIILAAGEGRRLGCRPKASLRIGGRNLLERLSAALRDAGISEIGVVIGPYRDQLLPLAHACGARVLEHPLAGATLIDSQRLALADHLARQRDADLLLVLADLPFLSAAHIRPLLARWQERPPSVHAQMPIVDGVRGHPLILSRYALEAIAATPRQLGIRDWLARHPERVQPVHSPLLAYVSDVDTPDDLAALELAMAPERVCWPGTADALTEAGVKIECDGNAASKT